MNRFVENQRPDRAILTGHWTDHSIFRKAIRNSKISSLPVPNPKQTSTTNAVALGAAKIVKDRMESQGEDCFEDDECERVRMKADQRAGSAAFVSQDHLRNPVEL